MTVQKINQSYIAYNEEHPVHIRQYYLYCVDLLKAAMAENRLPINLVLGNYRQVKFPGTRRLYKLDIQYEHTLVKPGGRDAGEAVTGKIRLGEQEFYLVRICDPDYYASLDFVIEYSRPNIVNIRESGKFERYVQKCRYLSPLLYPFNPQLPAGNRSLEVITTFSNPDEPRRRLLLQRLQTAGVASANVTGHYGNQEVREVYTRAKILVNVHQTDHHHTFEELRVLPALLCGCLVVSEDVPLKEYIPYAEFVIWSGYGGMAEKVQEVQERYDDYVTQIFHGQRFAAVVESMRQSNEEEAGKMVKEMALLEEQRRKKKRSFGLAERLKGFVRDLLQHS